MTNSPPSQSAYEFIHDILYDGGIFSQRVSINNISLTYCESSSDVEKAHFFLESYGRYLTKSEEDAVEWLDDWIKKNDPRGRSRYKVVYRGANRIF